MAKSSSHAPKPGLYGWLDARLDLDEMKQFAGKKTVPVHKHTLWYYWGGISLFLFIVQVFSGFLLLVYYRPGDQAFESVRQITYDIEFGWLVRSAHAWSANLMVLAVFVHMFSVYFMKAYRKPREFGWWSGILLAALTLLFGFSGYLLPMDELSFFATKVGLEIPRMLPGMGPFIVSIVQGGEMVSSVTIQRFFALHAAILPLLFMGVLAFHLWLVQKHGNAMPPAEGEVKPRQSDRRTMPFFPDFFAKDLAMWLIALNVLTILATLFPWDLGAQADLAPAPVGIHPEWYFMSHLNPKVVGDWVPGYAGEVLGIGIFTLAAVLWALIPLYDRGTKFGRAARHATWFGWAMLVSMIVLTIWGYVAI